MKIKVLFYRNFKGIFKAHYLKSKEPSMAQVVVFNAKVKKSKLSIQGMMGYALGFGSLSLWAP